MSTNNDNPTPEQLREEVERTREDLADTVDELAARLDVKSRVRESVDETKARVSESVHDATDRVRVTVEDTTHRVQEAVTEPDGSPKPAALAVAGGIVAVIVAIVAIRAWRGR